MTQAKKNTAMQQQMINVDKAVDKVLEQETPPLVVNRNQLKVCWMTAEVSFASKCPYHM